MKNNLVFALVAALVGLGVSLKPLRPKSEKLQERYRLLVAARDKVKAA